MYENVYAQWRISWCIEYYYLLQWPTVTDDQDEMPLADIDTSDTHFRYNYNAAPIKFMHTWRYVTAEDIYYLAEFQLRTHSRFYDVTERKRG